MRGITFILLIIVGQAWGWGFVPETTFHQPVIDGYRLDSCYYPDAQCGSYPAGEYCRGLGYETATDYQISHNIGRDGVLTRTLTGYICEGAFCDAYLWIRCN